MIPPRRRSRERRSRSGDSVRSSRGATLFSVGLAVAGCGARTSLEVVAADDAGSADGGGVRDASPSDASSMPDATPSSNRICKAGEGTRVIATGQIHPYAIVVDTDHAYWTNTGVNGTNQGSVRSAPLAGGAALTLASGED